MTYITPLNSPPAEPKIAAALDGIKTSLGMVPNLYATVAKSPAAFDAMLQITQALAGGRLTAAEREVIALATSQANDCQYCVSAHTVIGKGAGLTTEQTYQARAGAGRDARSGAIAAFAKALIE